MGVIIDGTLDGFRTRKDRTVAVTLNLNELDSVKLAELTKMNQEYIKCYLSRENITKEEQELIDESSLEEDEKKSPSQRMRNVIYLIWKDAFKGGRTKKTSSEFYRDFMEQEIEKLKEKLD